VLTTRETPGALDAPTGGRGTATSEAFAALVEDRLVTSVFQPLVHLATGEVVGYEALSRGPQGSPFASAAALFGQAEVDGLEAELDWVCLGSAFEAFAQAGAPPSASLFVNMSVGMHLDRCPPDIQRVVARAESSMRVFIEVNDTAIAADPGGVLATVDRARELGWGVSVDDVGSSPGCLAVLPLVSADVVKLDMRMLRHEELGDLAPAVAPLLRYVETSGATLVVKGIESDADLQFARALGATVGQGYHLGAPEPLVGAISAPRAVVPLIGSARDVRSVASPRELVEDNLSHRMTSEAMLEIGGFFVRRAVATGSSPIVLVGQGGGRPLDAMFLQEPMAGLRESAVLCALFAFDAPTNELPGVRFVYVPGDDPLARESFLVILTESMAIAMVGIRPVPSDAVLEVVLTQDDETVHRVAEHLIRRIPYTAGDRVLPVGGGPHRPVETRTDTDERSPHTRSRWGLRRD
jgi:EAL domain-containing protein (putative c-di-GMP-specific phosphodiesterase class I)